MDRRVDRRVVLGTWERRVALGKKSPNAEYNSAIPQSEPGMNTPRERRVALGKKLDQPQGWHSRGYLPHLDATRLVQHVTFHLADSLPVDAIERIQAGIDHLPESEQSNARRQQIQQWLDAGHGSCLLREPACAQIVEDALLFGDGKRYQLLAWVVMPNHVHVLIEQKPDWPLSKVVQSWKRHTSRQIHRLGFGSPLWQRDYWDRLVRNERHLQTVKRYIEENPVAAGLVNKASQWPWGSARLGAPMGAPSCTRQNAGSAENKSRQPNAECNSAIPGAECNSALHTSRQVHGLDGSSAAADWPALRDDEVIGLLANYPRAGDVQALAWHSPRPLSAAALVDTENGRLFVKRHHRSVRNPAALAEEHRFIRHLLKAGAPVPEVLRNSVGESVIARGEWVFEVHACAAGVDLYRDLASWQPLLDCGHAGQAGMALARLHQAARGYEAPQRSTHILVTRDELLCASDPIAELEAQLPARPGLAAYLAKRDWRRQIEETILPRQQAVREQLVTQPRLWTHNDWHVSNLAWGGTGPDAQVSAVFDFGLASPTFALFDLATAIERNAIAWLELNRHEDIAHLDTARALIEGYRDVLPLDTARRALLAALLPVVHIDFALSEVEYFHAITHSETNADIAWEQFLLGHARWFDSEGAQALLDAIAAH